MQFHLNGFRPGDPEIPDHVLKRDASTGSLPKEVDVLIVGCGPAGLTLAAQLSAFPGISTLIVDQKAGPLLLGQADGIACRTPDADAFDIIRARADRIIEVTDDEVEEAMRALFADTHNVAEGAGAASLAAVLQERTKLRGLTVGIVVTGANVDPEPFARILAVPIGAERRALSPGP